MTLDSNQEEFSRQLRLPAPEPGGFIFRRIRRGGFDFQSTVSDLILDPEIFP
jgi:hypothetical protein